MSRPVRFILLLAGAGAAVAVARHLTRRRHTEEAKPFFADSYVPPTPAPVAQEPVVEPAPVVEEPIVDATPVVEEPVAEQSTSRPPRSSCSPRRSPRSRSWRPPRSRSPL